jgi:uncharacterized ferritin-like protein (DUF455 family)
MDFGWFEVAGLRLRGEPAREACFDVVRSDANMHEHDGDSPDAQRETIHRHMSNEITSLDIAAQMLIDFPEAPWDLKMEIARQCWDEARHVAALHRSLLERGGRKGEFAVTGFEWSVTSAIDNIEGRLATQNRTLEAGAMDVVGGLIRAFEAIGDARSAAVLDAILADEVQHVRFANRWIKKLAEKDRRVLFNVARAVRFLADANAAMVWKEGTVNAVGKVFADPQATIPAVNVDHRKLAEFDDEEIAVILKQAGFRTLVTENAPR